MIDGIPLSVADLTGWGAFIVLATTVVVGFMRGNITSRREVEAERSRADSWQQAHAVERAANREKDAQIGEILDYSRTAAHALEQIQSAFAERRADG